MLTPTADAWLGASGWSVSAHYSLPGPGNKRYLELLINGTSVKTVKLPSSPEAGTYTFSGLDVSGLPEGALQLTLRLYRKSWDASSGAADPRQAEATRTVQLDTTPPVVSAFTPADQTLLPHAQAQVTASYADVGSGINTDSVSLQMNATDVAATVAADGCTYDAVNLAEGVHNVTLTVADRAGNETQQTWTFTTDATAPAVSVLTPQNGTAIASATPILEVALSDATAGVDLASARLLLDDSNLEGTVTDGVFRAVAPTLADGTHQASFGIADLAGNAVSVDWSFAVDTQGPVIDGRNPRADEVFGVQARPLFFTLTDAGSDVDDGSYLVVQLDGADISDQITYDPETGVVTYQPAEAYAPGEHTLSVSVQDTLGNTTEASWAFYVLPAPEHVTADQVETRRPEVRWDTVPLAQRYRVLVRNDSKNEVAFDQIVDAAGLYRLTEGDALPSGFRYRVWVRAVRDGGQGDWSEPDGFEIYTVPIPAGVQVNATDTSQPEIRWTPISNAVAYRLWIHDDTLNQPVMDKLVAPDDAYTLAADEALTSGHTYRVWVRGVTADGESDWTTPVAFTVLTLNPPAGITVSDADTLYPLVAWTPDPDATGYRIRLRDDTGLSELLDTIIPAQGSFRIPPELPLRSGSYYRVWIRTIKDAGESDWSPAVAFQVLTMAAPNPIVLFDTDTVTPLVTWQPVLGATGYRIRVRNDTDRVEEMSQVVPDGDSYRLDATEALTPGCWYRVWVRAVGPDGEGAWSQASAFYLAP